MKTKLAMGGLILVVIVLAASIVLGRASAQEYTGQKWEYITLVYNFTEHNGAVLMSDMSQLIDLNMGLMAVPSQLAGGGEIAHYLDYLGNLGYELVTDTPHPTEEGRVLLFFKRLVQ